MRQTVGSLEITLRLSVLAVLSAATLAVVKPAHADPDGSPVSIRSGSLPDGLQELARQAGIELLYDPSLVGGLRAPAVAGNLTAEQALRQLLADTSLTLRRAESGAWIVERPAAAPLEQPDIPVPEVLIIGRVSQNTDIRRFASDVQAYSITKKETILSAHKDNVEQFIQSRITQNTLTVLPSGGADPRSDVELRGLGANNTLVLIDGRRMPGAPQFVTLFGQPDLNAVPLHAIDRIETLTGTAGGIYGFGALGGVVNIVLDRETRGLDLHWTEGVSSRGDARREGLAASFGATSSDFRTDISLFASYIRTDAVGLGERDYIPRNRQAIFELAPQLYFQRPIVHGESVAVYAGENLVLKPQYGGASLASGFTFLPTGLSGAPAVVAAVLLQNSGKADFALSDEEARSTFGPDVRAEALLGSVRHRFDSRWEIYADGFVLTDVGETTQFHQNGEATLSPLSPVNPFNNSIQVVFPIEERPSYARSRIQVERYTGGLLAELPFNWRGTVEVSTGGISETRNGYSEQASTSFLFLSGAASDLNTNPFGDWMAFQQAMDLQHRWTNSRQHTQFRNQSLRLAGPLFYTPAGPATLTLLAEHRKEELPAYATFTSRDTVGGLVTSEAVTPPIAANTTSYSAELRARVFDEEAPAWLLRGLDVQLAVRRDVEKDFNGATSQRARFAATAYTAGAKVSPTSWLMLRGSYATGDQPPPFAALRESPGLTSRFPLVRDDKRGNTFLGADLAYLRLSGGFGGLEPVHATTAFLGAVLTPAGEDGPRLAIDLSRIRRTNDVVELTPQLVLANESAWPERVTRAPLSDADRAKGYTAGPVIAIDERNFSGGKLRVDAIDLHGEWPVTLASGRLRFYADATYHAHNVKTDPVRPGVERAGFRDGPLKLRANGGVDWSMDRLTIRANVQYLSSYFAWASTDPPGLIDPTRQAQDGNRIRSQTYLDLYASWRLPTPKTSPLRDLTLDFGVANVFDQKAPRDAYVLTRGPGFSPYGDPRQRRFELVLNSRF